jgi:hypothetical protein
METATQSSAGKRTRSAALLQGTSDGVDHRPHPLPVLKPRSRRRFPNGQGRRTERPDRASGTAGTNGSSCPAQPGWDPELRGRATPVWATNGVSHGVDHRAERLPASLSAVHHRDLVAVREAGSGAVSHADPCQAVRARSGTLRARARSGRLGIGRYVAPRRSATFATLAWAQRRSRTTAAVHELQRSTRSSLASRDVRCRGGPLPAGRPRRGERHVRRQNGDAHFVAAATTGPDSTPRISGRKPSKQ